jgi:hypothetical protein
MRRSSQRTTGLPDHKCFRSVISSSHLEGHKVWKPFLYAGAKDLAPRGAVSRTSCSRSTGCRQVRQRPAQQRRTSWGRSNVCGRIRPAAGPFPLPGWVLDDVSQLGACRVKLTERAQADTTNTPAAGPAWSTSPLRASVGSPRPGSRRPMSERCSSRARVRAKRQVGSISHRSKGLSR